ncbi:Crp/Fnr family transcriptional regulator [Xiashengella succiniciproducens]|jgi:CRP-like cAMP-binding protein|uniref:Crp/Fnr family transcriptional regulator n=1 Tax=Xiashengella succiniciproducens TaxID=2949635 RepID=A0A9J6ZP78_9BACT|nr:Crp/Fnr family transcriptional regulator [Alkaliflexus sp. Ai-910]MDI9538458.1 Crp/Fnr family transcriptional regulator [Bacteroidota bacterium]URW79326.1 Crp/Fnr family transcriptional regulator [Alkaliflexus sp. Ai-910]HHU01313.1 Crp/Fnr family transcriptional regulator [Bacteroidales bacterium]
MAGYKKTTGTEPSIKDISLVYSVLTAEEKEYLEKNHTVLKFRKNQIIYQEGEYPTGLLCLGSGKVKVFTEGVGGRDQIVRLAKAPDFIGYRALFAEGAHIASAVVIEPCVVFHIEKKVIEHLLLNNNRLCMNIIKSFASELGFTRFRTVTLTQKHIRGRLAESLILLRDIYGFEDEKNTLNIHLSREDLASFSNMTTSNAIRTLTTFTKEKLIEVEGRKIRLLDEESLERISRLG